MHGIECGLERAIAGQRIVVTVNDNDRIWLEDGRHGSGVLSIRADGDEPLPGKTS